MEKIIIILVCMVSFSSFSFAEPTYTDQEIVNAIYRAEGGENAQYLYGIRSVKYDNANEARQICFNTVRNQRKRHKAHTCNLSFLECLARRYCPINAQNDTKNLNQYWLKNVMWFLRKGHNGN